MIKLSGVEKFYHSRAGDVHALRDINLHIRPGEAVAILGQSGSGKSTLMNILGLLDSCQKGEYFLNGRNTNTLSPDERSVARNRELGFVFQGFNLLNRMNALENVALPLVYARFPHKKRNELAKDALEKVGLSHRLNHRPNELSGGQQQRVAIARAIVNNPRIILADEPTGNLDMASGSEILKILTRLNRSGTTLVLITHDREVAEHFKRRISIADGCIVYDSDKI